jgi:L-iditol 2-dehydrogenase
VSRIAVLHGPGNLAIEERPTPRPGPGEVLLAMECALTGGTVRKTFARGGHAALGRPPLPLGHEGVGRVVVLGAGVLGWALGDRALPGNSAACGTCDPCRRGRSELCRDMRWLSGFFADHLLVPARHVETSLQRVPAGLAPEVAALADNLACVLKGHTETPGRAGETALVLGTGPLGLLWCWALARADARVTLVGRRPAALAHAAPFGAPATASADDLARRLATGERFDLVVEAVGSADTWALALTAVAPGGRVQGFGGPPDGTTLPLDARRLHYDEITLTASFHHTPRHLAEALALLAASPDPWRTLLADRPLALDDLPAYLAGPAPAHGRKAVVRCSAVSPRS